jgi:nucleoside-diphosphate-sugar epimerase
MGVVMGTDKPQLAVLGATGYSGRAFLRNLDQAGTACSVTALVRRMPAEPLPGVRYLVGSLPDRLPAGFPPDGTAVVVHLAGERRTQDRRRLHAVNVAGTAALLDRLRPGVAGLIYASSMSVYGQGPQYNVSEEHPVRPGTPLAHSLAEAERLIVERMRDLAATGYLLRPRFLTGADDPTFLPSVARLTTLPVRLPSDPVHLSICDVDDYGRIVARLVRRTLERADAGAPVQAALNVGYRQPITLARLCEIAGGAGGPSRRWLPVEALISLCRGLPGEAPRRLRTHLELVSRSHWADVGALQREIGWDITQRRPEEVLRSYFPAGSTNGRL